MSVATYGIGVCKLLVSSVVRWRDACTEIRELYFAFISTSIPAMSLDRELKARVILLLLVEMAIQEQGVQEQVVQSYKMSAPYQRGDPRVSISKGFLSE